MHSEVQDKPDSNQDIHHPVAERRLRTQRLVAETRKILVESEQARAELEAAARRLRDAAREARGRLGRS